jgi:peptidoglycan/xylan/chitin deacetylase (PgdA/CDA1 family)
MIGATIRRAVKVAALPAGLLARRRPTDVAILIYHRLGQPKSEIELTPDAFEQHLRWIAAQERPRSLDDALAGDGGAVVTFDDGTRDFHEHALPLLVRYQVPCVLYLATGMVANGGPSEPDALTWRHLEEAAATGLVTIGSHTHSHADLTRAAEPEAADEMRRSKEMIEDRMGTSSRHFAYPWGVGSPDADRAARRLFDTAAGFEGWRLNRRGSTDPYRLARIPILRADGQFFFRRKVEGRLNAEGLFYRLAKRGPWRFK